MRDATHPRKLKTIAAASLSILALLAGCGGGADTQTNQPPQNPPSSDITAPSAPTSLTATAINANRIDLSWNASSDAVGVAGYRIYRDGAPGELASVTTTEYSDTNVVAGTAYSYAVRAFDAAGNTSGLSAPASATTPASNPNSGLDSRPANASCRAWDRVSSSTQISLERYTALTFTTPIAMLQPPGDSSRWFVVQQNGVIARFSASNPSTSSVVIDLSSRVRAGGEMGLLGMAFHPDFPQDPRVFLSYTTGTPLVSRVSSFTSSDQGATLNAGSEQILLSIDQPEENHNGGHIAFGPDGYLYIGIGDGGGGGDEHGSIGNGQRLTTMLGKMLRIDVDGGTPYAIPPTNPFAGNTLCPSAGQTTGECPEIFAWGLRNPWRWSFDRTTGEMWVADVGQGRYEEVNQVTLGGNYGWRCREGAHDFASNRTPGCSASTLIDPVTEYGRDLGRSITGGYVYRGSQATALLGRYLFADFASGRIFAWLPENASAREPTVLMESGLGISSFAQGNDGELFIVDYGGTLQRIVFAGGANPQVPSTLSATGCVSTSDARAPAPGLIPYKVNAPFWSDGAEKDRWLALPNGQTVAAGNDGDWQLPIGSVLVKHFRIGPRLIETRLLMRHPDGEWGGFSYEWNSAQTDATLVRGGAERDVGIAAPWIFPSEAQCVECHTNVAGRSLGLETAQLNGDHLYPSTGRTANQLTTLSHIGVLSPPIDPATQPALPDPYDTTAPLGERARAYLHTNCAFCHRPTGPTPSTMDLRNATALSATNTCNAAPQSGDVGLGASARLIVPGNAASSILVNRMNRRDEHAMPPIGSNQIDTAGVALITEWINSLSGC